jgi:hypothetical protein
MAYWIIMPFSFSGGNQLTDIVVLFLAQSVRLRGLDGAGLAK